MLYELSIYDVMTLQSALSSAQWLAAENAGAAERSAGNRHLPVKERAAAARMAKRYQERAEAFEAVFEALKDGHEITSLEQAREALER